MKTMIRQAFPTASLTSCTTTGLGIRLLLCIIALGALSCIWADKTYTKNKKANRLFGEEKYEEALKIYEDALVESPGDSKLSMNKGSTHYKLGEYDKAQESYEGSMSVEEAKTRADLHYNLGNALFRQGEQLEMSGNPAASEKYKAAYEQFIKTLDLRPKDMDAKWNLQLAYQRMQRMQNKQQQQQNQQNDRNQQNEQNKQNGRQKQDNQDRQDKQNQQQKEQKDNQNQEKQRQKQEQNDGREKPQPRPQQQQADMEKKQAEQLLMQYADDADELNKPRKEMRAVETGRPEKDW